MTNILPLNSSKVEIALDKTAAKSLAFDLSIYTLNPLTCPEHLLKIIAQSYQINIINLTIVAQRQLLSQALLVFQRKGSVWAVKKTLTLLGHHDAIIHDRSIRRDGSYQRGFNNSKIKRLKSNKLGWFSIGLTRVITKNEAANIRAAVKKVAPAFQKLDQLIFTNNGVIRNGSIQRNNTTTRGVI